MHREGLSTSYECRLQTALAAIPVQSLLLWRCYHVRCAFLLRLMVYSYPTTTLDPQKERLFHC